VKTLDDLGPRICIMGPSNSGKSTLAEAIARKRSLAVVHLDQFYHLPNTDWQPRPQAEFVALHDNAIVADSWVIDGNYSQCLPQRLDRATGLILLDIATATSLLRYVRRSWFEAGRVGALEGGQDSVKWLMIQHIAVRTRDNRRRYRAMFDGIALPKILLPGTRAIDHFYRMEGLER